MRDWFRKGPQAPNAMTAPASPPPSVGVPEALSARHVEGATLFADRLDALACLPRGGRVAELGVAYGDYSQAMLEQLAPTEFHAFDLFPFHHAHEIWGRPPSETLGTDTHRAFYERRFGTEITAGVVTVFEGDSATLLAQQPDSSYDVIYIDADHTVEAVARDAEVAAAKLRPDGFLVFNDYVLWDHIAGYAYGIPEVVNRMCVEDGWTVAYLALHPQFFCDIALRPPPGHGGR